MVNKEHEDGYTVIDLFKEKKVDLFINTTDSPESITRSFNLRRSALMNRIFYITTISAAKCLVLALQQLKKDGDFEVFCLQKLDSINANI